MSKDDKLATQIVSVGREKKFTKGIINPPVFRASTVVFDTMDELRYTLLVRARSVALCCHF